MSIQINESLAFDCCNCRFNSAKYEAMESLAINKQKERTTKFIIKYAQLNWTKRQP